MFSVQLLMQAAVNGVLLGGVYALLALGLNLLFGVVRIAFLAYGDLVMIGMYIIYLLTTFGGVPLGISALVAVVSLALLGMVVHQLIIDPILDRPGVNQLLATGGLLVFLENLALVLWGADYRTLYVSLPRLQIGGLFISAVQLITFGGALVTLALLYLFLTRTFIGTAIRAVAQDREGVELMGVNPRLIYLITAGLGGALAGVVSVFFALQYSVYPDFGLRFVLLAFMIVVLGGLGNFMGSFISAFVISEILNISAVLASFEFANILVFVLFILMILVRPEGLLGQREGA